MAEIVITEFMDETAVKTLQASFDVLYDKDLVNKPEELAAAVSSCQALIVRNRTQVRGGLLAQARNLAVVGRLGVGLDNIDLAACRERGITVIPATGANNISVAEYVLAGLLMLIRRCHTGTAAVAAGSWPRSQMMQGGELYGRTLGLVGIGGIAREVARRAAVFGMTLIAYDPYVPADASVWAEFGVEKVTLDELCARADAVSLHVPLTPATRSLFNAARIASLKQGAVLINTARGGIVDESAVAEALISGQLGGAMFDVFAQEPLPAGSPLASAPNVVLTAHIGGVTVESNTRVSSRIAERVASALRSIKC